MNGRQAAKAAAAKITELEQYNARCKVDIMAYNRIITGLIAEEVNPCDWCEENADCKRPIKGKGCSEWWLAYEFPEELKPKEEETDESKRLPLVGSEGRA